MPRITRSDRTVPPPQRKCRKLSLALNQQSVGAMETASQIAVCARPVADKLHVLRRGHDAVAADKSVDLHPQGNEGDEVNESEQSEKEPAREKMRGLLDVLSPEKAGQERKPGAMPGDEAVESLGDWSDAGSMLIQPQRPSMAMATTASARKTASAAE